jgi:hypothetical protein
MNLLDLFALACAAHALTLAWMMKDGLFAELRDKIDVWGSYAPVDLANGVATRRAWIKHKIAYGLQCPICFTFHTAFWLGLIFLGPSFFCDGPVASLLKLPIYTLAAARISIWCFEYSEGL